MAFSIRGGSAGDGGAVEGDVVDGAVDDVAGVEGAACRIGGPDVAEGEVAECVEVSFLVAVEVA